ncbi:alpha/beta hydrolase [Xanthobacter versatilis]|uniref:alpha/beta hydrolase n=2 Tax=Xanthobacter autotrophicus (strain ATCC BAA-1158 / Py2) TaxID=78245 RepID=UPI00372D4D2B
MAPHWQETSLQTQAGPMPARLYGVRPSKGAVPLILHLHGGAFTGGTLECGAYVAALLAEAGAVVVSADYPLACERPFPFALTAAFGALAALYGRRAEFAGRNAPLYVAGEESGGNLAAGLAMMARDQQAPPLAGQILISPMLDPSLATASLRAAEAGTCGCKWADGWQTYLGSPEKAAHPYAAPLASSRLQGLPPALVVSAQDCPMRDESARYACALEKAGVATELHILPGPTHWPEGISAPPEKPESWAGTMRTLFSRFFETSRPRRRKPAPAVL